MLCSLGLRSKLLSRTRLANDRDLDRLLSDILSMISLMLLSLTLDFSTISSNIFILSGTFVRICFVDGVNGFVILIFLLDLREFTLVRLVLLVLEFFLLDKVDVNFLEAC